MQKNIATVYDLNGKSQNLLNSLVDVLLII